MLKNRKQAGGLLAKELSSYKKASDSVVLGIPRGGVSVASEISKELKIPLGVIVTKKIGAPHQEELAIGATSEEGDVVLDKDLITKLGISKQILDKQIQESKERVKKYKSRFKGKTEIKDKTVILVDDGIATGSTVEVAIKYLRRKKAKRIILATPVAPKDTISRMKELVDELVVLKTPQFFSAVGEFYEDFGQVSDKEVIQLLQEGLETGEPL